VISLMRVPRIVRIVMFGALIAAASSLRSPLLGCRSTRSNSFRLAVSNSG